MPISKMSIDKLLAFFEEFIVYHGSLNRTQCLNFCSARDIPQLDNIEGLLIKRLKF